MPVFNFVFFDGTRREVNSEFGSTVMEVAVKNGVDGIVAECGGSMSCGTCHVHLDPETFDKMGAPSEAESDLLDFAFSPRLETSRLSCQLKIDERFDGAIVYIPERQY